MDFSEVRVNQTETELNWVESEGGPLILCPASHIHEWEGIDQPRDGRVIQARFRWSDPDLPATDYDRACDVSEYVELIDIGRGQGLVLGGEPLPVSWVSTSGDTGGILVRWIYAPNDREVFHCVSDPSRFKWKHELFSFDLDDSLMYLFDASVPGVALQDIERSEEMMLIRTAMGAYSVCTAVYEQDEISLVLHRLQILSTRSDP